MGWLGRTICAAGETYYIMLKDDHWSGKMDKGPRQMDDCTLA